MSLPESVKKEALRLEVVEEIEKHIGPEMSYLRPTEKCWQPTDLLPELTEEGWHEKVQLLRQMADELPRDLLIVLIGDMITEEALPTYHAWLSRLDAMRDHSGESERPWAKWMRGWTAEENRHGDLLNRWLYLSGRVNMRSVENTIQRLIRDGFDPGTQNDPYRAFVYTSFQERATRISHSNVGRLARDVGDSTLQRICTTISTDEARHKQAYKGFAQRALEIDPNGFLPAAEDMLRRAIVMPAVNMTDESGGDLFKSFVTVAEQMQVYTANDYTDILRHLIEFWNLEHLAGPLSAEAARARDFLCSLPDRYERLAQRRRASNASQQTNKLAEEWLK
ncbi:MAG: acyl-ACP desaturase [Sumerlaeia bacterium]